MIRVKVLETGSVFELEENEIKVRDLLRKLGLLESEHVVLKNNAIVTEDDVIVSGEEVVVFTVKSGG
ncbi:MAG: MoaD/ThiS family protein [Desulfurococcaceae archaeon]